MVTDQRYAYARAVLGNDFERVQKAKVLCVGAGGIGCEVLKNLVQVGFGDITIASWIARLRCSEADDEMYRIADRFGHHRPIKPEQTVPLPEAACKEAESIGRKRDCQQIQPVCQDRGNTRKYQGTGTQRGLVPKLRPRPKRARQPRYELSLEAKETGLIMIPLADARRHVNKMCLAADVPLIESGTAGFIGQVQPIKKVVTVLRSLDRRWHALTTLYTEPDGMLRMSTERDAERIPSLHYPKHPEHANPLHCLGQKLSLPVRTSADPGNCRLSGVWLTHSCT